MKASRQLDVLIAEKFGAKVSGFYIVSLNEDGTGFSQADVPFYSSDIFLAMEAAEKFDLFKRACLYKQRHSGVWTVEEFGGEGIFVWGDTAAEAICKAIIME